MIHGRNFQAALAFVLVLGAPFAAANSEPPLVARPAATGLVDDLQQELARRSFDAARAKALVERLVAEFAVSGTKERSLIVRGLERCFSARAQGKPDVELVCHSARALASMAPESLPVLTRALENRTLLKEKEIGRTLVLALGKTRDKAATKTLLGLLDSPDDTLVAAASEALGEYEGAALAQRKELFEEVLKTLMQAKDLRDAQTQSAFDPNSPHDEAAARRYDAISSACGTTLQRLSKQEARTPELWQRWWNKNKRVNWDDKTKLG